MPLDDPPGVAEWTEKKQARRDADRDRKQLSQQGNGSSQMFRVINRGSWRVVEVERSNQPEAIVPHHQEPGVEQRERAEPGTRLQQSWNFAPLMTWQKTKTTGQHPGDSSSRQRERRCPHESGEIP